MSRRTGIRCAAGVFASGVMLRTGSAGPERGCATARGLTRFLAFGLTTRSDPPTVTVRNRYF